MPSYTPHPKDASSNLNQESVLVKIMNRLLFPLARLCLAHGVTLAAVEERLKYAFVHEATALQPGAPEYGTVSRISTVTGLNRREVTRLLKADEPVRSAKPPISTEIFARWSNDPKYLDQEGRPSVLKRQGAEPSFESLAQSITRDVHPRRMLDEMIRLGLVDYDKDQDSLSLSCNDFVPGRDSEQVLDLLGDNVGDHLDAAVTNVLEDGGRHHEQAVFADELSSESLTALRPLVVAHWKALREAMVPVIIKLIESDKDAGRIQDKRMRIGLYTFDEPMPESGTKTNIPSTRLNEESNQ
jgi:hypothetical protein